MEGVSRERRGKESRAQNKGERSPLGRRHALVFLCLFKLFLVLRGGELRRRLTKVFSVRRQRRLQHGEARRRHRARAKPQHVAASARGRRREAERADDEEVEHPRG